jgi:hypothetical protein
MSISSKRELKHFEQLLFKRNKSINIADAEQEYKKRII